MSGGGVHLAKASGKAGCVKGSKKSFLLSDVLSLRDTILLRIVAYHGLMLNASRTLKVLHHGVEIF